MVEPHQSCITENVYFGSALQNSGCIFHGHEKGATYRVWNPGAHRDGNWDGISCKGRDYGVTIDNSMEMSFPHSTTVKKGSIGN